MNKEDLLNAIKKSTSLESIEKLVLFIRPKVYEQIKDDLDNAYCFDKVKVTDLLPNDTQAIIMTKEQYENLFKLENYLKENENGN